MPFDGLFAAAVAAELQSILTAARIHKIHQPDARTLVLACRMPGCNHRLLISTDPQHARMHLTDAAPPNPTHPPAFCMLLRKHLEPARILNVSQVGLDRIIHLTCETIDSSGRRVRLVLIVELTGRHSNVILVEEGTGRILDAMHRSATGAGPRRQLVPGEIYEPPPLPKKRDPRAAQRPDVARLLALQPGPQKVARTIAELYDGFGPFAVREVLARSGVDPDCTHGEMTARALERVADTVVTLAGAVAAGRFEPVLIVDDSGKPTDFWAFRPVHVQGSVRACASASEAAATYFDHRLQVVAIDREKQRLGRATAAAIERLVRKVENLRHDLANAERADEYRLFGELLTAHLHELKRGPSATVANYHAGGAPVTIPLDPALEPAENAQRYFKRYAKARSAQEAVRAQLDAALVELAYLEQVALHIEMADEAGALAEIATELAGAGVLPKPKLQAPGARRGEPASSHGPEPTRAKPPASGSAAGPLVARTRRGARVLIGRSNRENDRLTLKTARPDDIWLHVKDLPGAHVILQVDGEPLEDDVADAAQLAAYFSKARLSSNVAVDWTRVRHVRKPRGARPGMVIYDHHRTVYVSPEEETVKALFAMSRR